MPQNEHSGQTTTASPLQGTDPEDHAKSLPQHGVDVRVEFTGDCDPDAGISTRPSTRPPVSLSSQTTTPFLSGSLSPINTSPQTPSSPTLSWRPYQGPDTNVLSDTSLPFLRSSPSQASLRTLKAVRRHKLQEDEEVVTDVGTHAGSSTSFESRDRLPSQNRDFLASVRRRVASLARPLRKGKPGESTMLNQGATGSTAVSLGVENIPGTPLRRARSTTTLEEVEVPKIKKAQIEGLDEATIEASRRARDISSKWKYDAVEDEENSE